MYNNCWSLDSVTFYSIFASFGYATLILFVFGILKSVNLFGFVRKFIDIDRIRQNRVRFEKFKKLTAEKHNAERGLKAFSSSAFLNFWICFLLINMAFKTGLLVPVTLGCISYHLWIPYHALIFRKYLQNTPVPEDLVHVPPRWVREADARELRNSMYLVTGTGTVVSEASSSSVIKRVVNSVSNCYRLSYSYVTKPSNLSFVAFVGGSDYIFAEANGRTTITTRIVESATNGTYSPDPDTRSKASALRRKGVNLVGCCEVNSRCLDSDLVDAKYEEVKPYGPARYRILEQQNSSLREEIENLKGKSKISNLKEPSSIE